MISAVLKFTGCGTLLQVMMNSMNVPSKRSTLEKKLDKLILALFATLFTMCVIGAIGRWAFFSFYIIYFIYFCSHIFSEGKSLVLFAWLFMWFDFCPSTSIPCNNYQSYLNNDPRPVLQSVFSEVDCHIILLLPCLPHHLPNPNFLKMIRKKKVKMIFING